MQADRPRVRPLLARIDFFGDDAELRRRAEDALAEADAMPQPSTFTGQDRAGSVTVVVDHSGDVQDVNIAREWRSHVGVGGVGDALFEAYTAASSAVVESVALQQLRRGPSAAPARTAPSRGVNADDADDADDREWLRRTWLSLNDIDSHLERMRRPPDPVSDEEILSPSGSLTLRLRGGRVAAIVADVRRVALLDAGKLRFEARTLFQAFAESRSRR